MTVPEIYSGPSHCVVYGARSSYQSVIAQAMITNATQGGGCIIFVGRSAFDGQKELERFQKYNGWGRWATKTRPILEAADLSDYVGHPEILLQDLKQLFLPCRRPHLIFHDMSAELREDDLGWWNAAAHLRRNLLPARVVSVIAGAIPANAIVDQRVCVAASGFELTVTEKDEVTHWRVQPRRGIAVLTEQEASHATI